VGLTVAEPIEAVQPLGDAVTGAEGAAVTATVNDFTEVHPLESVTVQE
jgi:hypothetical protein